MTTPPPPPGSGGNQPYDPSASSTSGAPSYGSAPGGGVPPQAPPPAPGGYPQQGGSGNGKTLAIISLVTGILGLLCCGCFVFQIAAIVTGQMAKKGPLDDQSAKFAKIGLILGIVGLVLGVIYWIVSLTTGGFSYNFETS